MPRGLEVSLPEELQPAVLEPALVVDWLARWVELNVVIIMLLLLWVELNVVIIMGRVECCYYYVVIIMGRVEWLRSCCYYWVKYNPPYSTVY